MMSLRYILFLLVLICSGNLCLAQELDENQLSKYKNKLQEVETLQKNGRKAQSYELLKEMIIDLNEFKNYNLDIVHLKSSVYLFASFCFGISDDPGGKYFYDYKKYLMDLESDEIIYQGLVEKFGVKTAKSLTKGDKKRNQELFAATTSVYSKDFDLSSVDTSLVIYNKKFVDKIDGQSSEKIIDLTVSGRGSTKDSAVYNALKLAINQGFSSFITTNTQILNDSLINDEVIQMSNGTINKFDILTTDSISNNDYSVVVKVLMAVNRMNDLVKSKGIESEFDGAEFAFNQKLRILNEQNEVKTLKSTLEIALSLFKKSIDYKVVAFDPIASVDKPSNWEVPINIDFQFNQNIKVFSSYLYNNLKKLSLKYFDFAEYKKLGLRSNIKILAIGPVPVLSYKDEVIARKNRGLNTPSEDEEDNLFQTLYFHNNKRIIKEYYGKKESLNEKELMELLQTCKIFNYSTSTDSIYYFIRPANIFTYYTPFIYFRNKESINLLNEFLNNISSELFNYTINNGVSNYSIKDIVRNNFKFDKLTKVNTSYNKFFPALDRNLNFAIEEPTNLFDDLERVFKTEHKFYSQNYFNVPVSNDLFNFIYDTNGDHDNMVQFGRINENINMYINLNAFEYTDKSIYRIKYVENVSLDDIQKIKKYKLIGN